MIVRMTARVIAAITTRITAPGIVVMRQRALLVEDALASGAFQKETSTIAGAQRWTGQRH
jgi:hypothetical protein